jgi:hypothetical protein
MIIFLRPADNFTSNMRPAQGFEFDMPGLEVKIFYHVEEMVLICVVIFVLQDLFKLLNEVESMFLEPFLEIFRNDKFSFDFHARILGRKFFL